MNDRIVVSQLGARMHYAVPRILHSAGQLERVYTDIAAHRGWPRRLARMPTGLLPQAVRRLCGRVPDGLPVDRVVDFPAFGLALGVRRLAARTPTEQTAAALWAAPRFARRVVQAGFGEAGGFYGFSGESLEQLVAARDAGLWTVVEQIIAPRDLLDRLMEEEESAYPDWRSEDGKDRLAEEFAGRERAEWAAADLVVCGSEFVRRAVVKSSGGTARCIVVPYGVDRRFAVPRRVSRQEPLRVLTVGISGLRKGTPYVLEAARRLAGKACFRLVGPSGVPDAVAGRLAEALEVVGIVPRSEIVRHFAWADVFLLPSLCEGSATVVYEALAAGLPVIATENTGTVVRDGREGFIVPIRSPEAIVAAIERLDSDRDLLQGMSDAASRRAADFDLASYGCRLRLALAHAREVHEPRPAPPQPGWPLSVARAAQGA